MIRRRNQNSPPPPNALGWEGLVLFGLGLLTAVRFNLIGMLYIDDIAFLVLAPVLFVYRGRKISWSTMAPLLILWGLWFLNAIATDIIRQSPFQNYARGWAKIACFGAALLSVSLLSEFRLPRLLGYFAGLAGAALVGARFFPDPYQIGSPWKFGYSPPLSLITVIAATAFRTGATSRTRRYAAVVGLAMANLLFNYRSMFGTLIGTVGLMGVTDVLRRRAGPGAYRSPAIALALLLVAIGGGLAVSGVYGQLASNGILGAEAKNKYELQTRGGVGILLGGRSESLVSTKAIQDSPVIGHGSWAEDRSYAALYIQSRRNLGFLQQGELVSSLIPSHSYILGSWVEAGIFGALFWAFCYAITIRALLMCTAIPPHTVPFAGYLLIKLAWDIPFSPFGAATRFTIAGQLCVLMWIFSQARGFELRSLAKNAFARQKDPVTG